MEIKRLCAFKTFCLVLSFEGLWLAVRLRAKKQDGGTKTHGRSLTCSYGTTLASTKQVFHIRRDGKLVRQRHFNLQVAMSRKRPSTRVCTPDGNTNDKRRPPYRASNHQQSEDANESRTGAHRNVRMYGAYGKTSNKLPRQGYAAEAAYRRCPPCIVGCSDQRLGCRALLSALRLPYCAYRVLPLWST